MDICSPFVFQLMSVVFTWYCETSFAKSCSEQELTVTGNDLKKCERSRNYCVTDKRDCISTHAMHSGFISDTVENFRCIFMETPESLTCRWTTERNEHPGKTKSSLIFSSTTGFVYCEHILFIGAKLNITLKMQNTVNREERLSGPYYAYLKTLVKPPRPVVTEIKTLHKSLNVTWTTEDTSIGTCQIRYKPYNTDLWTKISELAPVHHGNKRMYMIDILQPGTLYTVSVSCLSQYGEIWSDWSKECSGMTSESAPSSPPRVCYHTEDLSSHGTHRILLLAADTAVPAASGHGTVLGYNVSYMPSSQPHLRRTVTSSSLKVSLVVMRGVYDIDVTAFNSAGESPAHHLRVTTGPHHNVAAVQGLWVHSKDGKLWVQWETEPAVSEFAVERVAEANPNATHWTLIPGSGHVLTALTGDIAPKQTYNISVYPISGEDCGPPSSLQANLESGALVDVVDLRVATVTKQQAIIKWAWQRKQHQTNILQYKLMLRSEIGTQFILVTPDMSLYSFSSLKANTEYSVLLFVQTHESNTSKYKEDFTTPRLDQQEETAETITVVVPLLILIIAAGVFSITSQIVYRKYIILQVADPEQSAAARWLMSSRVTGDDQKVLQVVDLCPNETNEILVEDVNSKKGESIDHVGSNDCLTFKDIAESPPTHSNAEYVHSIHFPENRYRDENVCAMAKTDVDRISRPLNASDKENNAFKASIEYVEDKPVLAQGCSVDSAHTMSNISSDSIPLKTSIINTDSIPQHFKGYVSNIPTNTLFTGIISLQPNKGSSLSDPPQASAHDAEAAPTWSLPLSAISYVGSSPTGSASDNMEAIHPHMAECMESKSPVIKDGYVCIAPISADGDENGSVPLLGGAASVTPFTNPGFHARSYTHY
ncbi:interleukin-6 receptor subunit beta [Alosa alosa]|uniref:interleukin-6 receptor subunit beta n=1 Tax=Alosa alosa TaxID=278164 RepID=UPI00201554B3|nr:interleukin-6 receptor subunit beta [Alosa alosa]